MSETADRRRVEFVELLRHADIRTLVQYMLRAGVKIENIGELPPYWRSRFTAKVFQSEPYTWRNPKLYLLDEPVAARLALDELLRRIQGDPRVV